MAERDESNENEEPALHDPSQSSENGESTDPETGKVRQPEDESAAGTEEVPAPAASEEGYEDPDVETSLSDADLDFLSGQASAEDLAAERLADLQRVTAEYANYRKRTETNREVERERAVMDTVKALLPVLDDVDRAEKHGDLEGESAFATIAGKLRGVAEKLGLAPFGAVGEPFDHNVHEAIFQQPGADVEVETVADVVETGYTLGSTLVRAAKVVVAVPQK